MTIVVPRALRRLGILTSTTSKAEIKRAYARKLKTIDQAADPEGFQHLREAYEFALVAHLHPVEAETNTTARPDAAGQDSSIPSPPTGLDGRESQFTDDNPDVLTERGHAPARPEVSNEARVAIDEDVIASIRDAVAREHVEDRIDLLASLISRVNTLSFAENALLQDAVAQVLVKELWIDKWGLPDFSPIITQDFLEDCDFAFHWTRDTRAFNRAFGGNATAADALQMRLPATRHRQVQSKPLSQFDQILQLLDRKTLADLRGSKAGRAVLRTLSVKIYGLLAMLTGFVILQLGFGLDVPTTFVTLIGLALAALAVDRLARRRSRKEVHDPSSSR